MDQTPTLRFAVFEVDLRSRELRKRGATVHLPDKPFQVLAALLERPGELVTREELRHALWGEDTHVDYDNNLNAAVRKLRDALGDSADSPRFVETLPKRGYRFVAPLEPEAPASTGTEPRPGRRLLPVALALGLALAIVAIAVVMLRSTTERVSAAETEGRVMLAVMPFLDLDGKDRQFFADGLTEEMIMQLGRLQPERLGVIARMSSMAYRDTDKPVDVIGQELGVQYLLEGSIRADQDQVRITAQLIEVRDQTHLWSEAYDAGFDDLLSVQGDVAVRVAQALALELLPDEPLARARAGTRDTEAYQAYLRGRFEWNTFRGDRYPHAIEHFRQALERDPSYAAAWAGLANTYSLQSFGSGNTPAETFPKARDAAVRALQLDPSLSEAYAASGFVKLYHDYDLEGADRDFRRAVELAPNNAMAYHWWAGALSALERHDETMQVIRKAVELDPVSLSVLSDYGWYYLFADRFREGIAECREILEKNEYGWASACAYHGLTAIGDYQEALAYTDHRKPEVAAEFEDATPIQILTVLRQRRLEAQRQDERLRDRYPIELAMAAAEAGEIDEAFEWLERAYELREPWLVFLAVDPRFDSLADDPRHRDLCRRVGLPLD